MIPALIGNPIPLINSANNFPHAIHAGVMRVVAKAIRHAWAEIRSNPNKHLVPQAPGAPDEDRYTEALCQILDQMLLAEPPVVDGFTSQTFASISRSESSCNFAGNSLNKQPDILIRLADAPLVETRRYVGIYIEAKMVSMSNALVKYTGDGINRFIEGQYSWAMQEGIMLAYQRPKYRPISSLAKALKDQKILASVPDGTGLYLDEASHKVVGAACSNHGRSWSYVGGGDPGDIRVWHLWDLEIP